MVGSFKLFKITLAKHSCVWYTVKDIISLDTAEQNWGDERCTQADARGA